MVIYIMDEEKSRNSLTHYLYLKNMLLINKQKKSPQPTNHCLTKLKFCTEVPCKQEKRFNFLNSYKIIYSKQKLENQLVYYDLDWFWFLWKFRKISLKAELYLQINLFPTVLNQNEKFF